MKKYFISVVFSIVSLLLLASCSNNNEYQDAMDKGINSLGEKDYQQASIYFEIALKEKEGDANAQSYFDQVQQMKNTVDAVEQKEFDQALVTLQSIIDNKNVLKTLQEEAQKLKDHIITEKELISSFEEKMTLVRNLISKKSFGLAKKELQLLQERITTNETLLSDYQTELTKLTEQVDTALIDTEESREQVKVETKETNNNTQKENVTYNVYQNERFGFSLQYPTNLTMDPPPTNGDGATFRNNELTITAYGYHTNVINDGETIETYYEQELNDIPVEITYKQLNTDWYVLSYNENGQIIYKKFFFGDHSANTFIITYPSSKQETYGPITTHISKTFVPAAE